MPQTPVPTEGHPHAHGTELAEADFAELVLQLARRLRRTAPAMNNRHSLAPHQVRALIALDRRIEAGLESRPSDLAARLRIAPRSATDVLDSLADRGLVERARSVTDRRAIVLTLTEAGRRAARELDNALRAQRSVQSRELLSVLPAADRRQITDLLRTVTAAANAAQTGDE